VHKGRVQAVLLGHQLGQVFLLFHRADAGPSLARREAPRARSLRARPLRPRLGRGPGVVTGPARPGPARAPRPAPPSGCAPLPHLPAAQPSSPRARSPAPTSGLNQGGKARPRRTLIGVPVSGGGAYAEAPLSLGRTAVGPSEWQEEAAAGRGAKVQVLSSCFSVVPQAQSWTALLRSAEVGWGRRESGKSSR
jgi:hypothetical protein